MPEVSTSVRTGRQVAGDVADSNAMTALAKWGLAARATNYALIGVLVIALAIGSQQGETDQHGALQSTAHHTGGRLLVWLVAIGLAAYAIWRLSETAFGAAGKGKEIGPRLESLWRAVVYAALAASAFQIALGGGKQNQAGKEQSLSAQVMGHTGGRWLVGLVGVGLGIAGVVLVVKAVKRDFEENLALGRMSQRQRQVVEVLGVVGSVARGVVFALVGAFILDAAVEYDPQKAAGLDGALRDLRNASGGPVLLIVVAVGMLVFAAFGYCETVWRKT